MIGQEDIAMTITMRCVRKRQYAQACSTFAINPKPYPKVMVHVLRYTCAEQEQGALSTMVAGRTPFL